MTNWSPPLGRRTPWAPTKCRHRPHKLRCPLVTFTDAAPWGDTALCGASLREPALAQDWLREEQEAAWAHLQADK
ncbi:MAG: hypothetical protein KIG98_07475 [Comamonas sp.]|nr:hypothetical protein [Comamonas sp.]